jgi:cytochrome P450
MTAPVTYNPFEYHRDPYPLYGRLRDEAPLCHNAALGCWALSRFADVQAAARDWQRFSSAEGNDLDDTYLLWNPGSPESQDPPDHARLRDVVRRHFSPRTIAALELTIRREIAKLLLSYRESGRADLAQELAFPLPFAVICELLGFPETDRQALAALFQTMLERPAGATRVPAPAWEARARLRSYILDAADDRRHRARDDLLSAIVRAEQAKTIDREEIVGLSLILFVAGVTTTTGLISNSLFELATHPRQRSELAGQRGLMPQAIEELLRFEAPIQWLTRIAATDVELHDVTIPAGDRIILIFASANRDERHWQRPDELDFWRTSGRHLAFGDGVHFCLGAPLARLEGRLALEAVLAASPDYELDGPVEPRFSTPSDRGLASLPVAYR